MSESKNIENLISKIASEELSDDAFISKRAAAKKEIFKKILCENRKNFQVFSSLNFLRSFAVVVLLVATLLYLNFFIRYDKEYYLVYLDDVINELTLSNGDEAVFHDFSENVDEDFYY